MLARGSGTSAVELRELRCRSARCPARRRASGAGACPCNGGRGRTVGCAGRSW